jgi:Flp pilus assembly protein TadD
MSASAPALLETALDHHRGGRLAEAEASYRELLALHPEHPDALNLLGSVARQGGDLAEAEQLTLRAIAADPRVALYFRNLARTYTLQGRDAAAVETYRRALALDPADAVSLRALAELLSTLPASTENDEACIELYRSLVRLQPGELPHWLCLSHFVAKRHSPVEALALMREAAGHFPDAPDVHLAIADLLGASGQLQEALAAYQKTLELRPDDAHAYTNFGKVSQDLCLNGQAAWAYYHALKLQPECVPALTNLAVLFLDDAQWRKAEGLLRRAIELDPNCLDASSNLASALIGQGRVAEAVTFFQRVLEQDPRNIPALCSLGYLFDTLGDQGNAREAYTMAYRLEPTNPTVAFNVSMYHLRDGNYRAGWPGYEMRWEVRQFSGMRRSFASRRWRGEELCGQSILVFTEQGFGDTMQFVRFLPLLLRRGARVVLRVQPALTTLLAHFDPQIAVVPEDAEPCPETDWHCPLLSLGGLLDIELQRLPFATGYIRPSRDVVREWAAHIQSSELRVGLVWRGNPGFTRDSARSLPFGVVEPLLSTPATRFFSLQKGVDPQEFRAAEEAGLLRDLAPHLHDFHQTAGAIAHLDLVITPDTAVAHLAGAMGKPVWILLPQPSDWRWLHEPEQSPWYPTARLFRQRERGDWGAVMARVAVELQRLASAHSHSRVAAGPPLLSPQRDALPG